MAKLSHLEQWFPKLAAAGYDETSSPTSKYNCIAWAADDTTEWWWPDEYHYWPPWGERVETIASFVQAFSWLGYYPCASSRRERFFEKVALFADGDSPKHMARQLPDGAWTSKCGTSHDITHYTLDALDSYGPVSHPLTHMQRGHYGCAVLYMKRPALVGLVVRWLQRNVPEMKVMLNDMKKKGTQRMAHFFRVKD